MRQQAERAELFHETRDRKTSQTFAPLIGEGTRMPAIATLSEDAPPPPTMAYGYRTLDHQFCLADNRLGDFIKPCCGAHKVRDNSS